MFGSWMNDLFSKNLIMLSKVEFVRSTKTWTDRQTRLLYTLPNRAMGGCSVALPPRGGELILTKSWLLPMGVRPVFGRSKSL